MKIGFAGSGSMAAALARGLSAAAADAPAPELLFTDAGSGRAQALATATGGRSVESLADLAEASDAIVLAVKPAGLSDAAGDLRDFTGPVVSVLGATPLDALREALPAAKLLRTMPNVAVEVGSGVICHAPPDDPDALAPILQLLAGVATLFELPEDQLDAATAVMGCSPAYFALACGAIAEAGAAAGLEPGVAGRLVALSAAGTGRLLEHRDSATVQREVASPGGSTEAGLQALAEHGAGAAFTAAVEASLIRMAAAA